MPKKKPNYRHVANLPMDLAVDIFLWLPVKPLLRFRCVSKTFLALIDSPDFVKLHLDRSKETRNNRSLILTSVTTYLVNVDSTDDAVQIYHPLKNLVPVLVGSCNGLVLLRYAVGSGYYDLVIWNPFNGHHRKLPFADFYSVEVTQNVVYGIGYDSVHDDYKVVKMVQFIDKGGYTPKFTEVKVYSLKSNTWRRVRDFPYYLRVDWCDGVLSGGALHWVVSDNYESRSLFIAAFDLATEEYQVVLMPEIDDSKKFWEYDVDLAVLDGCLSIFWNNWEEECMHVWVMKSYGIRESWTKLVSVGPLDCYQRKFLIPLGFSKDGTEVLLTQKTNNLIWFDLESNMEKRVDVRWLPRISREEFFVQSLVPVDS